MANETGARALAPLAYHHAVAAFLEATEPELWAWFAGAGRIATDGAELRSELLRSTYRVDAEQHPEIAGAATTAATAVGLGVPVRIHQTEGDLAPNAGLVFVPDEAVVLLAGPIAELVDGPELVALFGHELAHHVLWTAEGGRHLVADRLLGAMAAEHGGAVVEETRRRLSLATELLADRGALLASGDLATAVTLLVKLATGLRSVSAEGYLRQADEVLAAGPRASDAATHPETFVRAAALRDWSEGSDADATHAAEVLHGPLDLDRLDLLGQAELAGLTRQLLEQVLRPGWLQTDAVLGHARAFFPDLVPGRSGLGPAAVEQLAATTEATRRYLAYVLLDIATADPELEREPLAEVVHLAEALGLAELLGDLVGEELALTAGERADLDVAVARRGAPVAGVAPVPSGPAEGEASA